MKENIYNINRNNIDIYSYLHNNMDEYDFYKNIKVENINVDKNKSRFELISKVFNIIKNTPELYNSDYIFNYYTFKKLNKEGLDLLLNKLNVLCYTPKNDYWLEYKNDILSYEDGINNSYYNDIIN